jgi:BASS family bile acid:Na+ symporter
MAYISGANLALSVTLNAVLTLLASFITPSYMSVFADQFVLINGDVLSISIIMILPIIAGLLFNHWLYGRFPIVDRGMPKLSTLGITIIITVITAVGRDSLLDIGALLVVWVLLHNILGYAFGYGSAKLFGMNEASSRTIALEVGMQNLGLASGIAVEMGRVVSMGLAPAVFGPIMNITGSSLAAWRHGKITETSIEENKRL